MHLVKLICSFIEGHVTLSPTQQLKTNTFLSLTERLFGHSLELGGSRRFCGGSRRLCCGSKGFLWRFNKVPSGS